MSSPLCFSVLLSPLWELLGPPWPLGQIRVEFPSSVGSTYPPPPTNARMHPAVSRSSCLGSPQAVHVLRPTSDLLLQGIPPGTGLLREPRAPEWCWALSTVPPLAPPVCLEPGGSNSSVESIAKWVPSACFLPEVHLLFYFGC